MYVYIYIYIYIYTFIFIFIFISVFDPLSLRLRRPGAHARGIVAIFYPFSQFCEINISLPSL